MALSTIENLKTVLGIGARPNLFNVVINLPTGITTLKQLVGNKIDILCKGAAIPAMTLGVIEVPFRGGRRVKIPGDRSWGDWTATFISDNEHLVRGVMVGWTDFIKAHDYDGNSFRNLSVSGAAATGEAPYYADILVKHLKQDGTVSRTYKLYDAFPTDVSAIDLSFDSTDTISEFTVTFQYHWMNALMGDNEPGDDADMDAT